MDSFGARSTFRVGDREFGLFRLSALADHGYDITRLPYSLRILLENLLRHEDGESVTRDDVEALACWDPGDVQAGEISFTPARVLLQDFTGVPAIVDLAAMRDAMAELGGDPKKINPLQPAELVIDHSMQVDTFGTPDALERNRKFDYRRNQERYAFLRWGQGAFDNFKVVPPYTGIVHQVNLEYLARVVFPGDHDEPSGDGPQMLYPDTLVGTDSHTPMVNGLGVLGWGVGGIEAEAAMLGQPVSMLIPEVVGFRFEGELPEGATATDLVLRVTEMLREKGVVGKFVEFYGPGIARLPVADRATIGNMSPEYGATCAIFPVDDETLKYLRFTGRSEEHVTRVEAYMKEQGLFHTADSPAAEYSDTLTLDLSTVEPSIAGPKRPQDRIPLSRTKAAFADALEQLKPPHEAPTRKDGAALRQVNGVKAIGVWGENENAPQPNVETSVNGERLTHGSVVIASITSCTNTSNPAVMIGAGILARKAAERGLRPKPWVKTSLAPGSRVVTRYLEQAGLTQYLDQLGFNLVGYGCATCIGNSGPLPEAVSKAIAEEDLVACSVLSGNRNFEGRIHSEVRANYLASPPLVVAYALAGRMDWDPYNEPIGTDPDGRSVFLKDIWPTQQEIHETIGQAVASDMFRTEYAAVYEGDEAWNSLPVPEGDRYAWDENSTYVQQPPYFVGMEREAPETVEDVKDARVLALVGDSITTDHISPAGSIKKDSPAGQYLIEHGVEPRDFNSYGSRRGNHEVMVRGTFANVRLRNQLAPGTEGGWTTHLPTGEVTTIFEAAERYRRDGTSLIILAGRDYGSGSSRDWAAKGPYLQGVRAVIAESYERIHRSNLVGMGIAPLQFHEGENAESLGLDGHEIFETEGLAELVAAGFPDGRDVTVRARREDGEVIEFRATVRIDTPQELEYFRHGGILQYVLRQLLTGRVKGAVSRGLAVTPQQEYPAPDDGIVEEGSIDSFPASDPPAY